MNRNNNSNNPDNKTNISFLNETTITTSTDNSNTNNNPVNNPVIPVPAPQKLQISYVRVNRWQAEYLLDKDRVTVEWKVDNANRVGVRPSERMR